jgi:hypothetical protein
MENWSIWLDLKIIWMTIYITLKGDKNAYWCWKHLLNRHIYTVDTKRYKFNIRDSIFLFSIIILYTSRLLSHI